MKFIKGLLTKKHNFVVYKWKTRQTHYGEPDYQLSEVTEWICTRCGKVEEYSGRFSITKCK